MKKFFTPYLFTILALLAIFTASATAQDLLQPATQQPAPVSTPAQEPTAPVAPAPAATAQPRECNAQNASSVQCFEQTLCECKLFRTSVMKNDPGGYRWDCGIQRPKCMDPNIISDQQSAKPYDGPSSVYIDKRD